MSIINFCLHLFATENNIDYLKTFLKSTYFCVSQTHDLSNLLVPIHLKKENKYCPGLDGRLYAPYGVYLGWGGPTSEKKKKKKKNEWHSVKKWSFALHVTIVKNISKSNELYL